MRRLAMVLLLAVELQAADIHVPGNAPTIPAAIALAQFGDRVIVAPGTWVGAVDFAGKAITVMAAQGAGVTTIDGGSADYAVTLSAAPGNTLLDGFTVIGGTLGRVTMTSGLGSSAVRRCRILGGAGIGVASVDGFPEVRMVEDCVVEDNGTRGLSGPMLARHCVIRGNGSPAVTAGGGVAGAPFLTRLEDCLIVGNVAQQGGGGTRLSSVQGSVFLGNLATSSGGAYYEFTGDPFEVFTLQGAAFLGNDAPSVGGVHLPRGGFGGTAGHEFSHCIFAGNTDEEGGYGLRSEADTALGDGFTELIGCTILGNRIHGKHTLALTDTIVRGGTSLLTAGDEIIVEHSNIEGGWPGAGNIDADPLFVDAAHDVYALLPGSPCVDAGSPASPHDPDGSPADIGALALSAFASAGSPTFGQFGPPALSGAGTLQGGTQVKLTLVRARPGALAVLILGLPGVFAPFKGGELVPAPQLVIAGLPVNSHGQLALTGVMPSGLPSGLLIWAQYWIPDAAATGGFAASNGLGLIAP